MSTIDAAKKCKPEDRAVKNFRDYLRLKCVHPDPDYDGTVKFLKRQADELHLPCQVLELAPRKPAVLMTWRGTDPSLPSVLLNSHTDVVPVFPAHWKYDPFEAYKDDVGNIYARGSQDMKCVGMQYIEAIRRLKENGKTFLRTIHLSFVPDEEIGGHKGMEILIKTPEFKNLNVAFALDEGLANPTGAFSVFYGERSAWSVQITCPGKPGHGSRFIEDTAAEKLRRIIDTLLEFRHKQEDILKKDPKLRLGDVTTVNLTVVGGGVQSNVVPTEFTANFDIRITPSVDRDEFEAMLKQWCLQAGTGVTYACKQKFMGTCLTPLDKDNLWWQAFSRCCKQLGIEVECEIFPAATDSRYLRTIGIPALGFSPMNNTPILLHDHNEYLNEDVYLRGIDIYCQLLQAIASVPSV